MARLILIIAFILLLGIGAQYLVVGIYANRPIDFDSFSTVNWILEIVYITFLVSFAVYMSEDDE